MVRKVPGNNKLSCFVIPPLPSSLPLPPLPKISSRILYERSVTHTSVYGAARVTHDLDVDSYVQINDYEKLEYVGDRLLGVCVDLVVNEVYPNMRQGVATMVHDNLVRNDTLAQLSDRYGITERVKTSDDAQYLKLQLIKVRGSAFESWIAGVYFDYLEGGGGDCYEAPSAVAQTEEPPCKRAKPNPPTDLDTPSASDPLSEPSMGLRTLFVSPPTVQSQAAAQITPPPPISIPQCGPRSHGQAVDYLLTWLRPLYLPILAFTLQEMRKYQAELEALEPKKTPPPTPPSESTLEFEREEERLSGGAVSALVMLCINQYGVKPVWTEERVRHGVWKMICEVRLPDGRHFIKWGEKPTKKLGKAMAAMYICREMGVMAKRPPKVKSGEAKAETPDEKEREQNTLGEGETRASTEVQAEARNEA